MEKLLLDMVDSSFQNDGSSGPLFLNALLGAERFSSVIFNEKNQVLSLKTWEIESDAQNFQSQRLALTRLFQEENWLKTEFQKSRCSILNQWVSLVPTKLFNENHLPSYLKLLMENEADRMVFFSETVASMNARLVWAAEKDLIFFCQSVFPKTEIRHIASQLIAAWARLASPHQPEIYVNVRGRSLQIGVFERGELLLFNTFFYQNATDFLYFVLLAYEQFRFNPEAVPLFLSGELVADSEIYRMLYRFIYDIRFVARPDAFLFPAAALELPGHLNFDICTILNTD